MRIAFSLLMICLLFAQPQKAAQAAREAVQIWGMDVIPSLFPYMVLCKALASQLQSSKMPVLLSVSFLGLLGGSPSGAAVLGTYAENKNLSAKQLLALCALTGTISPMFLLHTLKVWFKNPDFCRKMCAAHLIGAAISAGLIYITVQAKSMRKAAPPKRTIDSVSEPIAQSIDAVLNVGGCIIFYSVLSAALNSMLNRFPVFSSVLHALLEIAGGMCALAVFDLTPVCCAALAGFGGLSILSQNLRFLRPLGISFSHLLGISALRACCCGCVMWLLGRLFS